jgi:hypothetical protein
MGNGHKTQCIFNHSTWHKWTVRFMVLPQDPSKNQTGQMGTRTNMHTVVKFMGWPQYPLINQGSYMGTSINTNTMVKFMACHNNPVLIRMEVRQAPASIRTRWLKIKCLNLLLIYCQLSRLYWAMLLVSSTLSQNKSNSYTNFLFCYLECTQILIQFNIKTYFLVYQTLPYNTYVNV